MLDVPPDLAVPPTDDAPPVLEFAAHDLIVRHHQGTGSRIIQPKASPSNDNAKRRPVQRQSRLGGLLDFYCRKVA